MCTNWWQCKHQWKQTSIKTGTPSAWWWVLHKLFIFFYINYALKCQEIYLPETFWGIHGSQCHVFVNGKFMHFSTHAMQVCVCVCVGYFDGWWAYLRRIEPVVFVIHTWFSLYCTDDGLGQSFSYSGFIIHLLHWIMSVSLRGNPGSYHENYLLF